jgi:hypothetical protein
MAAPFDAPPLTRRHIEKLYVHSGQAEVLNAKHRFKVVVAGRRWGKTQVSKISIIRAARQPKSLIWYVAPTYRMAKTIMYQEIIEAIPQKWITKANETTLEIRLKNGTRIELKGADKPDTLRGVGLHYLVIDEAQDIRRDTWTKVLRPTLSSTGGQALIIGCVKGDTRVLRRDGAWRIETLSPERGEKTLTPASYELYGIDNAYHRADGFWENGVVDTRVVTTQKGFRIEASKPHPLLVMDKSGRPAWRSMKDLQTGDRVAIDRKMEVWGDRDPISGWQEHQEKFIGNLSRTHLVRRLNFDGMTKDLAYLLGIWVAEGSYQKDIYRTQITCGDSSVGDFLIEKFGFTAASGRTDQWTLNSMMFGELLRYLGMPVVKAPQKFIPDWVWQGRREWAMAFVAGMFDGDGSVISKRTGTSVVYYSASEALVRDLQLLMTNIGIVGRVTGHAIPATKIAKASYQWRLTIQGPDVGLFRDNVALQIERKQKRLDEATVGSWSRRDGVPNMGEWLSRVRRSCRRLGQSVKIPVGRFQAAIDTGADISYRTLKDFVETHQVARDKEALAVLDAHLRSGYFWDEIVSLEESRANTYDFTIPDTHSFWSNGFISHNTPKGFNWLYDVFMLGQRGDIYRDKKGRRVRNTWKSWQFRTADSPFIPPAEVEAAKSDMDEKSFNQEYLASFETMSGRVYHCFDRTVHVGNFKFNPKLPIWVGMDFNVDPMSAVILQPQPDGSVWAVDEIVLPSSNTEEMAEELERRLWRMVKRLTIYPDPAGAARGHARGESDLQVLREKGFRRLKFRRKHPRVSDRVNAVNRMLRTADGQVRFYVDHKCRNLIGSLEQTLYKPNSREIDKSLGVEHITDALGYCIEIEFPTRKFQPVGISI